MDKIEEAEEFEEMKKARINAKRASTREMNRIKQTIAEDGNISVDNLKELFAEFTLAHENLVESYPEFDTDDSDIYFCKQQQDYITVLNMAKDSVRRRDESVKHATDPGQSTGSDQSREGAMADLSRRELLGLFNLPKVELQIFDGNPLHFHEFIKTFDVNVDSVCEDSDLKMSRLMQYTSGCAKDAIRGCQLIGGNDGYSQARSILHNRFGNPHLVTERIVKQLRSGKPVRSPQDIQQLSDDMRNALLVLSGLHTLHEVNSQSFIVEVIGRFQNYVQNRWRKRAFEKKKAGGQYPDFKDLVNFVADIGTEANDPVYGNVSYPKRQDKVHSSPKVSSSNASVSQPAGSKTGNQSNYQNQRSASYAKPEAPCVMCTKPHRLWHCDKFKALSPRERLGIVVSKKLCHNCLLASHDTASCGKRSLCAVAGCGEKHTMYIHCPEDKPITQVSHASFFTDRGTHMPIVQVLVNGSKTVYALLDSGSSNSFCSRELVQRLGIKGEAQEVQLSTLNKSDTRRSEMVNLSVSSDSGEVIGMSGVFVVDAIPVKSDPVNVTDYAHFADIGPIPAYSSDRITVDLLIGQDTSEALIPLEVRRGKPGEPFATRTLFGWCVNGNSSSDKVRRSVVSNFVSSVSVEDDIDRLWRVENEGVDDLSWSVEDHTVIALWDRECKLVDGHYELPIPWKDVNEPLPNNFLVAKTRLDSLFKRFDRDGLRERYGSEITKLLEKGYAERVPERELHAVDRAWYLPHRAVISDKKPDKLRVVFDCASKFKGKSLNERCLQGPDLINKLISVLIRFRQHSYAVQADVEAMYNQVRIPVKDRDALRFLWYVDGSLVCYRMTSHLFGGIWCASSSTYALRRTIKDSHDVPSLIKSIIDRSFYVDDCLSSLESESEVKTVISETPRVLNSGSFNLTSFVVNNEEMLNEVADDHKAKEVLELGPESEGRVLGIKWHIMSDMFFFVVRYDSSVKITRRRMLSVVSAIFDPLGVIGPAVLTGKLLFQDATSRKLNWDDGVPSDIEVSWKLWTQSLERISELRIPRCVKPCEFNDSAIELHHFSDASLQAYGCCSYIRCINRNGNVHVALVMSKNKVAPLKRLTIPRLELQAAVLSVKVDAFLKSELDIAVLRSYFWVDSEVVLKYIANDCRRFHIFVGNRVSVIRQLSEPDQWHHVSGKDNPADLVTRGQSYDNIDMARWFSGPDFLRGYKSEWQMSGVDKDDLGEDPEVRKNPITTCGNAVNVHNGHECSSGEFENPLDRIMTHYSSWYRMKRCLAWWVRFLQVLKREAVVGRLSVEDISHAGDRLIRRNQSCVYSQEIDRLAAGELVKTSSSLMRLSPYLDARGVLRVGGRLNEIEAGTDRKHPIIIHGNDVIAGAIVKDIHCVAHVGVEWCLSIARKTFWIVKARPLIKRIVKSCVTCRRLYAKPCEQLMADLPKERVQSGKPPFSHVGIDVFGPFYVKLMRSEVKRYGCIYTCFNTRAVHIEILHTLETESFLNSFRRFIARRGYPEVVFSDNGTNFVGGEAELRRSMNEISEKYVHAYATQRDITWHFNPPAASHMGGVWERMIGVIRRVLQATLPRSVRLTDEILQTVLCEVECIVNGRPLTKLSDDPSDLTPLTPNHLLLMRSCPNLPPGKFDKGDEYRRRWRHVQHLANQFWRKWIKMYLPELQKRSKWSRVNVNVKIGDLVLITEEMTPRSLWPLALVKDISKGRDGLVRSIRLKTQASELVRPITKVVLLEAAGDE